MLFSDFLSLGRYLSRLGKVHGSTRVTPRSITTLFRYRSTTFTMSLVQECSQPRVDLPTQSAKPHWPIGVRGYMATVPQKLHRDDLRNRRPDFLNCLDSDPSDAWKRFDHQVRHYFFRPEILRSLPK